MRRLFLSLLFLTPFVALAQDKKTDTKVDEKKKPRIAINDPTKLKDLKDYAVQGEYIGTTPKPDNKKIAVQVYAQGDGQFKVVPRDGGLPGDGWDGKADPVEMIIKNTDGKVTIHHAGNQLGEILDGKIMMGSGNLQMALARVDRKSPTLGEKPPAGAIVLFDKPEDIEKWEKCKVDELSDGKFLGVGGRTKQKFQSFTLHLEFRLPWMPNSTGQQRGNSGVYIQDRYELQILDSFGLKGVDNECGGIYKESAPKVNMCFPPMTWQTYDIDFTAATFVDGKKTKPSVITVKHNGEIIHDKLELKSNTPGGGITKEVPEPGAIYLQNHGDPVVYRNIWIVEKK